MAGEASRDGESNGRSRPPDREGVWASPPTGSRAPDRRVPVAAPEGAEVWLAAPLIDQPVATDVAEVPAAGRIEPGTATLVPESVEWIEIVEDLQRDVVEPELVEPETEPSRLQLAPAAPREEDVADAPVAVAAVLSISLEPEWPGNVHIYDITIDARDGTFVGVAAQSSNVPGETIRGVFSIGFADIDFTAVYPPTAPHYAWFGSGPRRGFTGTDSRGNVFHTAGADVTNLAYVINDEPPALLPALTVVEDQLAEPWFDMVEEPQSDAVAMDQVADIAVAEPSIDVPVASDEPHDVAATEPGIALVAEAPIEIAETTQPEVQELEVVTDVSQEETPEPAVAAVVETPVQVVHDHAATCRCLACGSAAFEPVPVTEGPLAGKAFYFRAQQDVPDPT